MGQLSSYHRTITMVFLTSSPLTHGFRRHGNGSQLKTPPPTLLCPKDTLCILFRNTNEEGSVPLSLTGNYIALSLLYMIQILLQSVRSTLPRFYCAQSVTYGTLCSQTTFLSFLPINKATI